MEILRSRTLALLDAIPEDLLKVRVHDFYSPIGWHFGHIAMTEEYWTLTRALGRLPHAPDYTFTFANIPENPKDNRVHLPDREQIKAYMAMTREKVLHALEETDLETDDPLIAEGYAWEFAYQHECQHQETIAELLQLLCKHTYMIKPVLSDSHASVVMQTTPATEMVPIPGGTFLMGSDDRHGYDNEKRAHEVTVAPFQLERHPVTAGQWAEFIQAGGYERPELWTPEGWEWRQREQAEMPEYWFRAPGGYGNYVAILGAPRFLALGLDPLSAVSGISWYEADAYARWRGKRLPTEAEWEYAAAYDPVDGRSRRYPWGDAETIPAGVNCGAHNSDWRQPLGESHRNAFGLENMAGTVWEWTSTPFLPYPGFVAYPYDGYSKDHMDGAHYVCRGGSWATSTPILRCSFRNWYVPTYRQGFLGLRLAAS
jgi:iron(II)-dependent oxidoreductase